MLSALVTGDDFRVHPFCARILDHLDRPVPAQADLRAQWEHDVLRLHLLWSGSSQRAGASRTGLPQALPAGAASGRLQQPGHRWPGEGLGQSAHGR